MIMVRIQSTGGTIDSHHMLGCYSLSKQLLTVHSFTFATAVPSFTVLVPSVLPGPSR
jgi:hypothetical protein